MYYKFSHYYPYYHLNYHCVISPHKLEGQRQCILLSCALGTKFPEMSQRRQPCTAAVWAKLESLYMIKSLTHREFLNQKLLVEYGGVKGQHETN